MKITKSTLSQIINEELTRVLYEFDAVDEGEDEHGNYVWDSTVKRSEDAMKRKKRLADRMPDHIRGKTRNPETGEDEPYEEGADRGTPSWDDDDEIDYEKGRVGGDEVFEEGPTLGAASYNKRDDDEESEIVEGDNDDWIQAADRDIERRGTKGRCTGAKFGSESCPKGSREYNLAKTFKKMARDRKNK